MRGTRQKRSECIRPDIGRAIDADLEQVNKSKRSGRLQIRYRRENGYQVNAEWEVSYNEAHTCHIEHKMLH